MATYLKMNGNGNYLKLPSVNLNKIVADVVVRRKTDAVRMLWDFRAGIGFTYLQQSTNGTDSVGSGTVKINGGANVTNNTAFIPNGTRCTIEHNFTLGTDDGNVFSNNGASTTSTIDGDIYDIKLYNGTTLLAHYDMNTGTVQDQSGNGRHATLTGGTWVSDGPTPTAESNVYQMKQRASQSESPVYQLKQRSSQAETNAYRLMQNAGNSESLSYFLKQRSSAAETTAHSLVQSVSITYTDETNVYSIYLKVTGSEMNVFDMLQNPGGAESTSYEMLQRVGVVVPSIPYVDPNDEYVPPANRSTLVIEHVLTGQRYMFPRHNINMETPTGFVQTQYVPREFKLAEDQTPVPDQFYQNAQHPYVAQPKDPLNQYYWRDKPWS